MTPVTLAQVAEGAVIPYLRVAFPVGLSRTPACRPPGRRPSWATRPDLVRAALPQSSYSSRIDAVPPSPSDNRQKIQRASVPLSGIQRMMLTFLVLSCTVAMLPRRLSGRILGRVLTTRPAAREAAQYGLSMRLVHSSTEKRQQAPQPPEIHNIIVGKM